MKVYRVSTVPLAILGYGSHFEALASNEKLNLTILTTKDNYYDHISKLRNVETIPVTIKREISLIYDLFSLIRLIFIFVKNRPDIVHSSTPKAGLLVALAGFIAGVPTRVHTYTGQRWITQKGFSRKLGFYLDKLILFLNTKCLADSHGQARFLNKAFRYKKKIAVIRKGSFGGIDFKKTSDIASNIDRRKEREALGFCEEDYVFLYLGRVTKEKGIQELIDAFFKLRKTSPRSRLLVVGPYERELDPLDEKYHFEYLNSNHIDKLGFSNEVIKLMMVCDCFVLPSYREGFGTVVLEAASLGRPSIVSNIYGLKSIVEHKKTGLICKVRNSKSLLENMVFAVENKEMMKALGSESRNLAYKNFDYKLISDDLIDFYRSFYVKAKL